MVMRSEIQALVQTDEVVLWQTSVVPISYPIAVAKMDAHVAAIAGGTEQERVWLLEHPAIYTAGTSAKREDLVEPNRFPVFETGRGGQYTYHGPGQRVAYVMLNLAKRGADVRAFVAALENWLIATLAEFGVVGERREDRVGIWVKRGSHEDKIAALGIRVRKGVTLHGISLNVNPALEHFNGIVPCGLSQHGVTSLADLGISASMQAVDAALAKHFENIFGPIKRL